MKLEVDVTQMIHLIAELEYWEHIVVLYYQVEMVLPLLSDLKMLSHLFDW